MKQAIQLCFLSVFLFCNPIYAQPSPSTSDGPQPLALVCSTGISSVGSMDHQNLQLTLSTLNLMARQGLPYGTYTSEVGAGAVQGVYYCTGNGQVAASECEACVGSASEKLESCTFSSGVAWYADCTVRVANSAISGVLQEQPIAAAQPVIYTTPDPAAVQAGIEDIILGTIAEAVADFPLHYSFKSTQLVPPINYIAMAQCSPDLSFADCQTCLHFALSLRQSPLACPQCRSGPLITFLLPSCKLMFGFE